MSGPGTGGSFTGVTMSVTVTSPLVAPSLSVAVNLNESAPWKFVFGE